MADIIFYHINIETKQQIKGKTVIQANQTKYREVIEPIVGSHAQMVGNPVYAVHEGRVYKSYSQGMYNFIDCTGYARDYEIDNTWVVYYASGQVTDTDRWYAEMSTDTENVRIAYGPSIKSLNSYLVGGTDIDMHSVEISTSAMSESFFTYGSTYSPNCSIEISPTRVLTTGTYIRIEFEIDGVWRNFGVFYIKTPPDETSEYMSVQGFGMLETALSFGAAEFDNGLTNVTIPELCNSIKSATGIPVIFEFEEKLAEHGDYWNNAKYIHPYDIIEEDAEDGEEEKKTYEPFPVGLGTYRNYLSAFAVTFHSNVVERNGVIYISHVDNSDFGKSAVVFDESTYAEEPVTKNRFYFSPSPISVSTKKMGLRPWKKDYIPYYIADEAMSTEILTRKVTSVTETIVSYPLTIEAESMYYEVTNPKNIERPPNYSLREYAEMIGVDEPFAYYPIDVEFLGYNAFLYAGGTIALKVNDEIKYCYLGNVNYSWDGMFSISVSTPCDIEIDGSSSIATGCGFTSVSGMGIPIRTLQSIASGDAFFDGSINGVKLKDGTVTADKVDTKQLVADEAFVNSLKAEVANIGALTTDSAVIKDLTAESAAVKKIVIGSAEAEDILTKMLNAGTALIGDGTVDSLIAIRETVDKATILNLLTSKINVTSDSGNLLIKDNTMQIKDNNGTVRVQIGLDSSSDYSMYVWDEAGNLMFDAKGMTDKGIQRPIIRNDMVADDANIAINKIDMPNLRSSLQNGEYRLDVGEFYYDGEKFSSKLEKITESINAVAYVSGNYSALIEVSRDASKKEVTLACRIFLQEGKNQKEITKQYSAADFQWYRMTDDAGSDAIWNGEARSGQSIVLGESDINYGAKFICSVVAEKDRLIGTKEKKALLWGGKVLIAN